MLILASSSSVADDELGIEDFDVMALRLDLGSGQLDWPLWPSESMRLGVFAMHCSDRQLP